MVEYYKELLCYIKKRTSNKDYAHDIVQDTFAKVISIENNEEIRNKRAFLYKVAKNLIVDNARKDKSFKEIPYSENEFSVKNQETEELIIQQDRQMVLMNELKKLPKKRKEAFVLHIIEGYSRKEIADIMGISISAVEKHISRASIELKEKLKRKES